MNSKILNKIAFKLSEKSPVILVTLGVAGLIGGTVLAVKSSRNNKDIYDEYTDDMESLELKTEEALEEYNNDKAEEEQIATLLPSTDERFKEDMFSLEDYKRIKKQIAMTATRKYLSNYWKVIVLDTASVVCIVAGFRIIAKRYAALAIAYTTLDTTFKEYRKRVAKEVGKEKEEELYYDYKVELKKIKDKDGKTKEVKTLKINSNNISQYARFFDKSSTEWSDQQNLNRVFLQQQQKTWQRILETRGHVFLNEVLDALGLTRVPEGQVVGWKYNSENGDNYISFGLFNDYNREAINANKNEFLLDFNVDGIILNEI